MAIVLGTDFSTSATEAFGVASRIAARLGEPLRIVHVIEDLGAEIALAHGSDDHLYRPERESMRELAAKARAFGAEVEAIVAAGSVTDVLATHARDATLLVVGFVGRNAPGRWLLGGNAERLARVAPARLLVVRAPEAINAWLDGCAHRLKLVLGADRSEASRGTARSLDLLTKLGRVEVAVIHVASGAEDRGLERALERDLEPELAAAGVRRENMTFEIRTSTGDRESELVATADALAAPLLAVGAHQRPMIERLWRRSISRRVVHLAPMSVLVVPSAVARLAERPAPAIHEVLVATDLSEVGNRAIPYALALLRDGGVLHLAHVRAAPPPTTPVLALAPTRREATENTRDVPALLEALAPRDAAIKGISVQPHVLEGDVATALCASAEQLAVDAVCLASRARGPLSAAFAGSTTLRVLARSKRPVFVVREPES